MQLWAHHTWEKGWLSACSGIRLSDYQHVQESDWPGISSLGCNSSPWGSWSPWKRTPSLKMVPDGGRMWAQEKWMQTMFLFRDIVVSGFWLCVTLMRAEEVYDTELGWVIWRESFECLVRCIFVVWWCLHWTIGSPLCGTGWDCEPLWVPPNWFIRGWKTELCQFHISYLWDIN